MRIQLATGAIEQIREVTNGLFHIEADGAGVALVEIATGRKIPLAVPEGVPSENGRNGDRFADIAKLSERERVVFEKLGEGMQMQEIADEMGVSLKTVETYRARIKDKMNIKRGHRLLCHAIEWRLLGRPGENRYRSPRSRNGHDGNPSR